jgi:hypothetical protein
VFGGNGKYSIKYFNRIFKNYINCNIIRTSKKPNKEGKYLPKKGCSYAIFQSDFDFDENNRIICKNNIINKRIISKLEYDE